MYNREVRQRKAQTMVNVLEDFMGRSLGDFSALNVGGSAGIIDQYLANHFKMVVSIDIDEEAIAYAK